MQQNRSGQHRRSIRCVRAIWTAYQGSPEGSPRAAAMIARLTSQQQNPSTSAGATRNSWLAHQVKGNGSGWSRSVRAGVGTGKEFFDNDSRRRRDWGHSNGARH